MTDVRTPWLDTPSHRAWLERRLGDVVHAARTSPLPGGGFAYQDADGSPMPGRPPQLFLTARVAYAAALALERGIPGSGELLDHAMASLCGFHVDREHGGFLTEPGTITRKQAYDHVHVGLAAASAMRVGHPRAAEIMARAVDVIDGRFWDEGACALTESFAADWSDEEPYRGANATMHGVEAFLAMGSALGESRWHERAYAMAQRIVDVAARWHGWLIPEHFTASWEEDPDYNKDEPLHPFRPYGATFGHSLEWARFLLELDRSTLVESGPWLREAAEGLARRALDDGWGLDGRPGLPYTCDWEGRPVATVRLHWPVCEGIQASAALLRVTGDRHWETWYRRLWDHAARYFVDDRGTWVNELDEAMRPGTSIWPGRPDVYHCVGALVGPTLW